MLKFEWKYCPTCDKMTVICPKCGNNCCNGGAGEIDGVRCDMCKEAYKHMKTSETPSKPHNWEQIFRESFYSKRKLFTGELTEKDKERCEKMILWSKDGKPNKRIDDYNIENNNFRQ